MNSLNYEEAKALDNRTYFQYYLSLLRTNHILIFSFLYIKDYNSQIIKYIYILFYFCYQLFNQRNVLFRFYNA